MPQAVDGQTFELSSCEHNAGPDAVVCARKATMSGYSFLASTKLSVNQSALNFDQNSLLYFFIFTCKNSTVAGTLACGNRSSGNRVILFQSFCHMIHPAHHTVHHLVGIVRVVDVTVEAQPVASPVILSPPSKGIDPICRLRRYAMLEPSNPYKGISEVGLSYVFKHALIDTHRSGQRPPRCGPRQAGCRAANHKEACSCRGPCFLHRLSAGGLECHEIETCVLHQDVGYGSSEAVGYRSYRCSLRVAP